MSTSYPDDQFFDSGRPWVDPMGAEFGAVPGGPDCSGAFAKAVAAAQAINGYVKVPPGRFVLATAGVDIQADVCGIEGSGEGTILDCNGADLTVLRLSGFRTWARNLQVLGPALGCTKPAIVIASGAEEAQIDRVGGVGGTNVLFTQPGECEVHRCKFTNAYGGAIWRATGGAIFSDRNQLDQVPAAGEFPPIGTIPVNWAPGTAVTAVNSMVFVNGYILQCTHGGTTGSAPPTLNNYGAPINDGSAAWGIMGQSVYYGLQLDSGTEPSNINDTDLTGFFWASVAMTNTVSGGLMPTQAKLRDCDISQAWVAGVYAHDGAGLTIEGGEISNCGQHGLLTQANWVGDTSVQGALIYGCPYGSHFQAGRNHLFMGNRVFGAGQAGVVADGVHGVQIQDNNLGASMEWGQNNRPAWVLNGCDDYVVTHNLVRLSATGAVLDEGTGTHKLVEKNL